MSDAGLHAVNTSLLTIPNHLGTSIKHRQPPVQPQVQHMPTRPSGVAVKRPPVNDDGKPRADQSKESRKIP